MNIPINSPVKCGVRVCDGPLTAHIESYRARLEELGYSAAMVVFHLRLFAKLDSWLLRKKQSLWLLDETNADQFLQRCRMKNPAACRGARSTLPLLLQVLRDAKVVAPRKKLKMSSPAERLATDYRLFLQEERGLDGALALTRMDPGVLMRMDPPVERGGSILFPRRDVFASEEGFQERQRACTPEGLALFKSLCRYYYGINAANTASYVQACREMWESEADPEQESRNIPLAACLGRR